MLSQAVGAAWIIRFLTSKKTILRLRRDYLRPEKQIILPVLALGISSFVMLSTESCFPSASAPVWRGTAAMWLWVP